MKCITGLGNIGKRFELTRHDIDSEIADYILKKDNSSLGKQKFRGAYTIRRINGDKALFIGPMTMMNLSGEAVAPTMNYCSVNPEDLIVLYDGLDLEQGRVRLKQKGSAGGHDGMKSIIKMLGTDQSRRIRIDVGRPTNGMTVSGYVLQRLSDNEMVTMEKIIGHAARAIEKFVETSRFDHVMNESNGEVK